MIKNLWQIHSRDRHVEFMGKNKIGNTVSKIMQLDWSKMAKQFSVNSLRKFLCQYQASRQASTWPEPFLLRILDTFHPFKLLF